MRVSKISGLWSIFSLLACSGLWGQSFHGGIRGTVTDTSGAAVATAKLTLVDQGTGISRATISESGGGYSFPDLNPSTYTIKVETPGFKVLDRQNIVVSTQEFLIIDLKLDVGDVTQSINVTADSVPMLETENASTGQVIDNQKLADLPNMGRNPFYEGVKISQNVTPGGDPKFNRMEDQSGSSQISIAGGPITGNNWPVAFGLCVLVPMAEFRYHHRTADGRSVVIEVVRARFPYVYWPARTPIFRCSRAGVMSGTRRSSAWRSSI